MQSLEVVLPVILIFGCFALRDILVMKRRSNKKTMAIYLVVFTAAFAVALMKSVGVPLTGPTHLIERVIYSIIGRQ